MKTKRELADFGELSAAEAQIAAEIDGGTYIVLGDGQLPDDDAGESRQVRASFIRYLALGGCDKCAPHEKGLQIVGALVVRGGKDDETNYLDLEGCKIARLLGLVNCLFFVIILMRDCSLDVLNLDGSHLLEGFNGNRLKVNGDVLMRGVKSEGEVNLLAAKLGGDLVCSGATFSNPKGYALGADRLVTQGNISLSSITANGEVRLLGAYIGGVLDCQSATFSNPEGYALNGDALVAKGTFFLITGTKFDGTVSLHGAKIGILNDDPDCWPKGEQSIGIEGFRYGAILGPMAATDAKTRLAWLKKIDHMNDFSPQPYEQLAQVLRDMGHRSDAREVLIEKERLQRKDRRKRSAFFPFTFILWLRDQAVNLTVRYGHRPLLAFAWLAIFWAAGVVVFDNAAQNGAFKPNSSRVWQTPIWAKCAGPDQMNCYLASDKGKSYPAFSAMIYSADTLLPIVDLELQNVWIPDEAKAPWVRRFLWLQILAGWALSLLAVAGFSGLIKKSD